jgi:hypothetical protein
VIADSRHFKNRSPAQDLADNDDEEEGEEEEGHGETEEHGEDQDDQDDLGDDEEIEGGAPEMGAPLLAHGAAAAAQAAPSSATNEPAADGVCAGNSALSCGQLGLDCVAHLCAARLTRTQTISPRACPRPVVASGTRFLSLAFNVRVFFK